jgi:hypothetical protein
MHYPRPHSLGNRHRLITRSIVTDDDLSLDVRQRERSLDLLNAGADCRFLIEAGKDNRYQRLGHGGGHRAPLWLWGELFAE